VSTTSSKRVEPTDTSQPVATRWTWVDTAPLWPMNLVARASSALSSSQSSVLVHEVLTVFDSEVDTTKQVEVRPKAKSLMVLGSGMAESSADRGSREARPTSTPANEAT
jgi:hypothetical protein